MISVFEKLGLTDDNAGVFDGEWRGSGAKIDKISPIDGKKLASIRTASADDYDTAIARAQQAFLKWRVTPGPVRGDTVRRLGNALREAKHGADARCSENAGCGRIGQVSGRIFDNMLASAHESLFGILLILSNKRWPC